MTIDVRGTSTINKGAQLMLVAIARRLGSKTSLSTPPQMSEFGVRASLGLKQTLHDYRRPRRSILIGDRIPKGLRDRYGMVADREITGVVDASGFAYSDSFGLDRIEREAIFGRSWARRSVPKVMLPQAFGPFKSEQHRNLSKRVLETASLIFVRDTVSAEHVESLGLAIETVLAPDFTIPLAPAPMERLMDRPFGAIVPNAKMITTGVTDTRSYVAKLSSYADAMRASGLEPVVVLHERGDSTIGEAVSEHAGTRVFISADPIELKTIIGQSELLVGSRFHALVGGLSQGVPTVALGWSHKYAELLNDFGVPDWIAQLEDDATSAVGEVLADARGIAGLNNHKVDLVRRVDSMWTRTEGVLGLT